MCNIVAAKAAPTVLIQNCRSGFAQWGHTVSRDINARLSGCSQLYKE